MNSVDRFIVGAILGMLIFTNYFLLPDMQRSIEKKIDAMNTCGPAEVVVSGEGE